jgi:hypothetical protein
LYIKLSETWWQGTDFEDKKKEYLQAICDLFDAKKDKNKDYDIAIDTAKFNIIQTIFTKLDEIEENKFKQFTTVFTEKEKEELKNNEFISNYFYNRFSKKFENFLSEVNNSKNKFLTSDNNEDSKDFETIVDEGYYEGIGISYDTGNKDGYLTIRNPKIYKDVHLVVMQYQNDCLLKMALVLMLKN